jgi:hypothetical protein
MQELGDSLRESVLRVHSGDANGAEATA